MSQGTLSPRPVTFARDIQQPTDPTPLCAVTNHRGEIVRLTSIHVRQDEFIRHYNDSMHGKSYAIPISAKQAREWCAEHGEADAVSALNLLIDQACASPRDILRKDGEWKAEFSAKPRRSVKGGAKRNLAELPHSTRLPKLVCAVYRADGTLNRHILIDDPRDAYCRAYNSLGDDDYAIPVNHPAASEN